MALPHNAGHTHIHVLILSVFVLYFSKQLWNGILDALYQTFQNFVDKIFHKINFLKCYSCILLLHFNARTLVRLVQI